MIISLLIHPITLSIVLIFCVLRLKDIIMGSRTLHHVRSTVNTHIKSMGKQNTDQSWEGLSYELKVKLTDQRRLKKGGKLFVGSRRVADFAARFSKVYNNGDLVIESIQRIRRIKAPRQMYVVRLRSRVTGTVRMTIWVAYMPQRVDGWGVQDVCIHPPSGDLGKGDTLTGAKVQDPNAPKAGNSKKGKPAGRRSSKKAA